MFRKVVFIMKIRIVNLKNYTPRPDEILIKVDRSTPLGNPFFMKNESMRDKVCDKYDDWFDKEFHSTLYKNDKFLNYLHHIHNVAKTNNVALGCWCYPKRCHAQTIVNYILKCLPDCYQVN